MQVDPEVLKKFIAEGRVTERGVNLAALNAAPAASPQVPTVGTGAAPDVAIVLAGVENAGYGRPEPEYRFHKRRKWQFDFAWVGRKVALEREGGRFQKVRCPRCSYEKTVFVSRHHSKDGLERDAEKYNAAGCAGWIVIRATPGMLADGRALDALLAALASRKG